MRNTLLSMLVLSLAASPSHAAGPTVGWEWEVDPWEWVTIDKTGAVIPDQKTHECPAKLFATTLKSPVDNSVSLVSFTRDLSNDSSQMLEIATGPIDHDSEEDLDRIMLVVQAFAEAAATCTPSHGQCRIGIPELVQHMQNNRILEKAAPGDQPITFVVHPEVGFFNASGKECVLVWDHTYNTKKTNTQTNVGMTLFGLWSGALGNLFSGVDDQSSGWQVSLRGYRKALELGDGTPPVSGMREGLASGRARGVFALLAYLMNAETYSEYYKTNILKNAWRGWRGKNVQDVFLKTPPHELVNYVKSTDASAASFFTALKTAPEEDKAKLTAALCVATADDKGTPLDCRPKLDAMIELLNEADETRYLSFLQQIPKPIPMFKRYKRDAFVVEARRSHNPLNEASTFHRLKTGKFDLKDRRAMRALLAPLEWH